MFLDHCEACSKKLFIDVNVLIFDEYSSYLFHKYNTISQRYREKFLMKKHSDFGFSSETHLCKIMQQGVHVRRIFFLI